MQRPSSTPAPGQHRLARTRHRADGTLLEASPAARALYSLAPQGAVSGRLQDLLAPEDAVIAEQALADVTSSADAVAFVARLRSEPGAARRVEISAHAEVGPGGDTVVFCVARDALAGARTVAEQVRLSHHAEELAGRLERIVASVPGIVWETWFHEEPARQQVSFVSEQVEAMTGYSPGEWLTQPHVWLDLIPPEDRDQALAVSRRVIDEGTGSARYPWVTKDGRRLWVESHMRVLRDEAGHPAGMCGVTMDITARKLAEEEHARLQGEVIAAQARLLAELSTPLIPISPEVVAMPLIGSIDRARADQVMNTLLQGIAASGARHAILDITGVPTVDTQVADALIKAARGVALLGAEVVLTGIRPEVAQTLVELGADLSGLVTRGTLQDGIRYATRRR